jgi:hypothetical protein
MHMTASIWLSRKEGARLKSNDMCKTPASEVRGGRQRHDVQLSNYPYCAPAPDWPTHEMNVPIAKYIVAVPQSQFALEVAGSPHEMMDCIIVDVVQKLMSMHSWSLPRLDGYKLFTSNIFSSDQFQIDATLYHKVTHRHSI